MKKQVRYLTITPFDSTLAHFRVTIETRVIRNRQTDGSPESLCYVNNKGNAVLTPNIYLVFSYRGDTLDENKSLYTSYPQLFKIRATLEKIKDLLVSDEAFSCDEGVLEVKPGYQDAEVIADIGKEKKWISFKLAVVTEDENTGARQKGVLIQISGNNDLASLLSYDEFLTVYTIVKDLDLLSLQNQYALFTLLNNEDQGMGYVQTNYQQQYQPQPAIQPQYYPQQQYQGQQQYGNYPQQGQSRQRPATPRYNAGADGQSTGRVTRGVVGSQAQQSSQNQYNPVQNARTTTPIVNMKAVDETPVESIDWGDDDSIEGIFEN